MSRPLKNPCRWKEAYLCRTTNDGNTTSKEAILQRAHERNDAWGREVAFRANLAVSDLHAADARYHRDCLAKFFTNRPSAESSTEACDSALEELLSQMSLDVTRIWNSAELYTLYSELGGTLISRRFLIKSVCEHFHPNLLVLTSPGVASILVFRGKDDTENDCDAEAISKIAKKIKVECQSLKKDGLTYSTRINEHCSCRMQRFLVGTSVSNIPATEINNASSYDRQYCYKCCQFPSYVLTNSLECGVKPKAKTGSPIS